LLLSLAAEVAGAGDVVAASWRCCWHWRPMLLALAMLVALFVRGQTTPHTTLVFFDQHKLFIFLPVLKGLRGLLHL